MGRKSRTNSILAKVVNDQAAEKARQIIEKHIRKLVVRNRKLESVPEKATTSFAIPKPESPPVIYSRIKDAFESAFYNDNDEVIVPQIQSLYHADFLNLKNIAIPNNRSGSEKDIEETLIILRAFDQQALNVQERVVEQVEETRLTAGHEVSPYTLIRLAKLNNLRESIQKETKILHEQFKNVNKYDKKYIKGGHTFIIIDSNGDQISFDDDNNLIDKKKTGATYLPRKTHKEIIMEFKIAFCAKTVPELDNIYSRQNTGEIETDCSMERRNAKEHCDILTGLVKVMESDLLSNSRSDILKEMQNLNAESESLCNVDLESDVKERSKLLLNDTNTMILVNADGEEISDQKFNKFILKEMSL